MVKSIACILFLLLASSSLSYAFQTNSTNYRHFPLIISAGGDIVNSTSYKNYVASGIIAGIVESSSYKNFLGFFYGWLLANGEYCTAASQCEGSFCCSNACASSACPSTTSSTSSGGGGGEAAGTGGGVTNFSRTPEQRIDFSLSPSIVKVKLALGKSAKESITVRNTGDLAVNIPLTLSSLSKYVTVSDRAVSLEPGQSKKISLGILAKDVGSFIGQLIARANGMEKSAIVIMEFISEAVLFDVKLDIPSQNAEIEPGKDLKMQITLLNVGAPEKVGVFATYYIKDLKSNILYEETETFSIEKQLSYQKSFKIPENIAPGSYVAITEIRYADSFAVSSQLFEVIEKKKVSNAGLVVIAALIIISIISFLAYKSSKIKQKKRKRKKIKRRKH